MSEKSSINSASPSSLKQLWYDRPDRLPYYKSRVWPIVSSSSSFGSRTAPLQISACRLQVSLSCAVLCHYRVAPVFVQVVSPPRGWSPLSSFLVIWPPSGNMRGPLVVFEAVDMPCTRPVRFSNPDAGLSMLVCDVEHTYFHFGLCGRKFVLHIELIMTTDKSCMTSVQPRVISDGSFRNITTDAAYILPSS